MKHLLMPIVLFTVITYGYSKTPRSLDNYKAVGDVVEMSKLLPTPNGLASQNGGFGSSVVGYENKVMIGARGNSGKGAVYIYEKTNDDWIINQIIKGNDMGVDIITFGEKISKSGNRVLISASDKVFVLELNNNGIWLKTATLTANDTVLSDSFGDAISLQDDRVVIGAPGFNDDQGAVYVFDLIAGSWSQTQKLTSNNGAQDDEFGISVSLSGDRILVGAHEVNLNNNNTGMAYVFEYDNTSWSEVQTIIPIAEGNQIQQFSSSVILDGDFALIGAKFGNGLANGSGAVHIFELEVSDWNQIGKITASDGESLDYFGEFIYKQGGRLIISANGDDDNGSSSGAAYIFDLVDDEWIESKKIIASDGESSDGFSNKGAIGLFGDRAFIGAPSSEVDNALFSSGSAYVFELESDDWIETEKLIPAESAAEDFFGDSVKQSNDLVIVGAAHDLAQSGSGSAYIFKKDGTNWLLVAKITPVDDVFRFGGIVDIKDNRAVVAAEDAVYVFEFDDNDWLQTAVLTPDNFTPGLFGDNFGSSISLGDNRVVVGAMFDGNDTGAVYIFEYNTSTNIWSESTKLKASDRQQDDGFGSSLSLFGNTLMVGMSPEPSNTNPRKVYVFEYDGSNWAEVQKLTASNAIEATEFGRSKKSISLIQDRVLIGAPRTSSAYVFDNVDGNWSESAILSNSDDIKFGLSVSLDSDSALIGSPLRDETGNDNKGAAYLFKLDNNIWSQTQMLTASDASTEDKFGAAVSIVNNEILVGANKDDDHGNDSGSVYIFAELVDLIFENGFD